MAIKKKEEINFDLLIGLGNPPTGIRGIISLTKFACAHAMLPRIEFL